MFVSPLYKVIYLYSLIRIPYTAKKKLIANVGPNVCHSMIALKLTIQSWKYIPQLQLSFGTSCWNIYNSGNKEAVTNLFQLNLVSINMPIELQHNNHIIWTWNFTKYFIFHINYPNCRSSSLLSVKLWVTNKTPPYSLRNYQWPLLLTWFNFNPSMVK